MFGRFHGVDDVGSSSGWRKCSVQQSQPEEDPTDNPVKKTKRCTCSGTIPTQRHGRTLQNQDNSSLEVYSEEVDNGVIDIDLRFRMDPMLAKRIVHGP